MKNLIETDNNIYWVEKRKNFVKLCFAFSPEFDTYLKDLDVMCAEIVKRIILNNYEIFCAHEEKKKLMIESDKKSLMNGFLEILVPKTQGVAVNEIERLLKEKNISINMIYGGFYSQPLTEIQKSLPGSIIITPHSNKDVFSQSKEFVSCPADAQHLAIYCVDIYGNGVESIEWFE